MAKFLSPLLLLFFFVSCGSYLEYTSGTKELNYSFNNKKVKRYSNLKKASRHPEKVVFLDISFAGSKQPEMLIQELNSCILKFPNLKKLNILGYQKGKLPENIFKVESLEFLTINCYKGLELNDKFSSLKNLMFLSLGDCGLSEVPNSVFQLSRLQGLDLTANQISAIPEEVSNLSDLRTIDLTNNSFTEIPLSLQECKHLKYLDLNNAEGTSKENLRTYQVGVNEIKEVKGLEAFPALQELNLFRAYSGTEELRKLYPNITIR